MFWTPTANLLLKMEDLNITHVQETKTKFLVYNFSSSNPLKVSVSLIKYRSSLDKVLASRRTISSLLIWWRKLYKNSPILLALGLLQLFQQPSVCRIKIYVFRIKVYHFQFLSSEMLVFTLSLNIQLTLTLDFLLSWTRIHFLWILHSFTINYLDLPTTQTIFCFHLAVQDSRVQL